MCYQHDNDNIFRFDNYMYIVSIYPISNAYMSPFGLHPHPIKQLYYKTSMQNICFDDLFQYKFYGTYLQHHYHIDDDDHDVDGINKKKKNSIQICLHNTLLTQKKYMKKWKTMDICMEI